MQLQIPLLSCLGLGKGTDMEMEMEMGHKIRAAHALAVVGTSGRDTLGMRGSNVVPMQAKAEHAEPCQGEGETYDQDAERYKKRAGVYVIFPILRRASRDWQRHVEPSLGLRRSRERWREQWEEQAYVDGDGMGLILLQKWRTPRDVQKTAEPCLQKHDRRGPPHKDHSIEKLAVDEQPEDVKRWKHASLYVAGRAGIRTVVRLLARKLCWALDDPSAELQNRRRSDEAPYVARPHA